MKSILSAKKTFSAEYRAWTNMKGRCHNPNHSVYQWYGARGISVCERWKNSFAAFLNDVGYRPSDQHTIDRIDNDGNYEPGNVRWATKTEQQQNTRQTRRITLNGETASLSAWARKLGLTPTSLRNRLRTHKLEVALTIPRLGRNQTIAPPCHRLATSKTGYKGCYVNKNRFEARIRGVGCVEYLGLFRTAEEAALAYNRRAIELWGGYAKLNEVPA